MTTEPASVIIKDPEMLSGEPVFGGTRVPFQNLLDYPEGGETLDEFLKQFPGVTREQAFAALKEANDGSCSTLSFSAGLKSREFKKNRSKDRPLHRQPRNTSRV